MTTEHALAVMGFASLYPSYDRPARSSRPLTNPCPCPAWPEPRRPAPDDACDSAAHRSASREWTTVDGGSGTANGRPTTAHALTLARHRRISARMAGTGRRDPNDGMGFVVGVAFVVNLMQETRKLVAIESRPAVIQAGEEFELAACEYRHRKRRDAETGEIGPV